ncbi:class I SAM-dependent rRNA methyltransferase [Limnochorda pilosa]|uniref:SAM-dependent methyltransferase n=1 Tax=Limnochorda pilosa TaxID=1555112 RepID=A0A0K2SLT2_LIMPI|nr:class I SAM-dependent rRNA methyltransferase [Limnochorda pilosa]BAS27779.1 SAM-dependent methyltransferase [Limnochorda pilosa]
MIRVVLKQCRRRRVEAGHPWVFDNEVARVEGEPGSGAVVEVVDHRGRFLARGAFSARSRIRVRLLTWDPSEAVDAGLIRRRIAQAWALRERILDAEALRACRVVYSEADFLPGLVVDRFGDVVVVQVLSQAMEPWTEAVLEAVQELFGPAAVHERSDAPVRELEGLKPRVGLLRGRLPDAVWIREHGLELKVDVVSGQKTGFFLDQRQNRLAIRPFAREARVLDCFAHTGGFALNALAGGARHVTVVEVSPEALALARENSERNGFAHRMELREANAFDVLRDLDRAGERYDLVVLDPPAFARTRHALPNALRGYKEINLRAMRLLEPGGFLATASCSGAVEPDVFLAMLQEAAVDAHVILRQVALQGQAADHPVLPGAPETRYLTFGIFQAFPRGGRR